IFRNRFDGFGFKLRRVTLGFSAHYWLLLMPFYFRKECPLNSGYLTPVKTGVKFPLRHNCVQWILKEPSAHSPEANMGWQKCSGIRHSYLGKREHLHLIKWTTPDNSLSC
ncbi:hypothetical protein F3045_23275, partial [Shigella flexneri]|nr:hypothetical protein [Shigella flexneri]